MKFCRMFFFSACCSKTWLESFVLYTIEMLPMKTQEFGLMKATGLGKGAVEGAYSSRLE